MRNLLVVVSLVFCISVSAQSMRQVWINLPDSVVPYLNESNRTELADYVSMNMDAVIQNHLKDTTRITALTRDYIDVRLSAASRLQMKLLPWSGGATDSILCVIQTYEGPAAESCLAFYEHNWRQVQIEQSLPDEFQLADARSFIQRPDSLSDEEYDELLSLVSPLYVKMELSQTDNSLTVSVSLPPLSIDEQKRLEPYLLQRKLNWNGKRFN